MQVCLVAPRNRHHLVQDFLSRNKITKSLTMIIPSHVKMNVKTTSFIHLSTCRVNNIKDSRKNLLSLRDRHTYNKLMTDITRTKFPNTTIGLECYIRTNPSLKQTRTEFFVINLTSKLNLNGNVLLISYWVFICKYNTRHTLSVCSEISSRLNAIIKSKSIAICIPSHTSHNRNMNLNTGTRQPMCVILYVNSFSLGTEMT